MARREAPADERHRAAARPLRPAPHPRVRGGGRARSTGSTSCTSSPTRTWRRSGRAPGPTGRRGSCASCYVKTRAVARRRASRRPEPGTAEAAGRELVLAALRARRPRARAARARFVAAMPARYFLTVVAGARAAPPAAPRARARRCRRRPRSGTTRALGLLGARRSRRRDRPGLLAHDRRRARRAPDRHPARGGLLDAAGRPGARLARRAGARRLRGARARRGGRSSRRAGGPRARDLARVLAGEESLDALLARRLRASTLLAEAAAARRDEDRHRQRQLARPQRRGRLHRRPRGPPPHARPHVLRARAHRRSRAHLDRGPPRRPTPSTCARARRAALEGERGAARGRRARRPRSPGRRPGVDRTRRGRLARPGPTAALAGALPRPSAGRPKKLRDGALLSSQPGVDTVLRGRPGEGKGSKRAHGAQTSGSGS